MKRRQRKFKTIFVNGKQKRVKRSTTIDGMDVDEFIARNADPIFLVENEMWEQLDNSQDSQVEEDTQLNDCDLFDDKEKS